MAGPRAARAKGSCKSAAGQATSDKSKIIVDSLDYNKSVVLHKPWPMIRFTCRAARLLSTTKPGDPRQVLRAMCVHGYLNFTSLRFVIARGALSHAVAGAPEGCRFAAAGPNNVRQGGRGKIIKGAAQPGKMIADKFVY